MNISQGPQGNTSKYANPYIQVFILAFLALVNEPKACTNVLAQASEKELAWLVLLLAVDPVTKPEPVKS